MDLSLYSAKPDKTIRQHTDELINALNILREFEYIKDDRIYTLILKACDYHDYGKANARFQHRIKNKTKFDETKEVAHNVLSLYFINREEFDEKSDFYRVAFGVLNHHHYYESNIKFIQDNGKMIENELKGFEVYNINARDLKNISKCLEDKDAILIKGFVHKCDYSASGNVTIEYKNDFLINGLNNNILNKFKEKNPKASWNDLQEFCINNRDKNLMITAQTGMGKTEAGLLWIGDNKGFFILPLKTAINAIYKRVREEIIKDDKNINKQLALLHSDSLSYYIDNHKEEMDILEYQRQGKQWSIPLNISTLDQIFDFVFRYPGYELKLATLSYCKIVIDEIQMYSPELLAYLIYGIKMIHKFGGKIAILTATLPPFVKDLLKNGDDAITFKEGVFVNDMERHNIKVHDSEIDVDFIYNEFIKNKDKESCKSLVVCNTVKKAQEVFEALEAKEIEVKLLHSKFIYNDRDEKEKEILKVGETENKEHCIWVATQIVEASLDIDFDYLYTELSELSGLFQRLGRCNRKGEKSVKEPNCHIFLRIKESLLTNGEMGNKKRGFIDKDIYNLSKEALIGKDGVLSESKKIELIDTYLTKENLKGSNYLREYYEAEGFVANLYTYEKDKADVKLRDIISYNIIPRSVYEENKIEIDKCIEELSDENVNVLDKIKKRDIVKGYTVPINKNDYEKCTKKDGKDKTKMIYKELKISKNHSIEVIYCKYDKKFGFRIDENS